MRVFWHNYGIKVDADNERDWEILGMLWRHLKKTGLEIGRREGLRDFGDIDADEADEVVGVNVSDEDFGGVVNDTHDSLP